MRKTTRRGISLGTVLMVSAVALVAAFSLAGLTQSHLNYAQPRGLSLHRTFQGRSCLDRGRFECRGPQLTRDVLTIPEATAQEIEV